MTKNTTINTGDDVSRQVLANHADPMVVAFTFDANTALHSHSHIRSTFVESDRFRFTVDGQFRNVGPGDS